MYPDPRRWLILVVLCLSTLVLVVDNMALTVAVPSLAADLGATAQDMQWILESYMLVFAGLLLTAGSLSDRYGRRKIMIIGLALFGLASLAATLVTSPGQLIAARVAMGIGGALVMPSTLSIMITVFADENERRKAMAGWGAVAMLGLVGGPVLGGALIASFGWESVFWINVPIAVLAILAAGTLMPESKGPQVKPDPLGAILSMVGMAALVWTINEFAHGINWISLGVAVVALAAFIGWELRTPYPMVPLKLFRDRDFAGGSLSLTLVQVGNGGLLLVLTQYLQFVLGYTPTQAGLAFIPLAIASLIFNGVGAGLGNIVSTTSDLSRFVNALLTGRLLPKKQQDEMWGHMVDTTGNLWIPNTHHGTGVFKQKLSCGVTTYGVDGYIQGTYTYLMASRDGKQMVAVNTNGDWNNAIGGTLGAIEATFCAKK